MAIGAFFDEALTIDITLSPSGKKLNGYWDIVDAEYYANDVSSELRATFVCEKYNNWASSVGQSVTVDEMLFRVNKISPDGTGILNFDLLNI